MRLGSAMPFMAAMAPTLVPARAAMAPRVSPERTVYEPPDDGDAYPPHDEGTLRRRPAAMRFGSAMPLAAAMAATVVPLRAAMALSVSPGATVTVAARALVAPASRRAAAAQRTAATTTGRVDRRVGMGASIDAGNAL